MCRVCLLSAHLADLDLLLTLRDELRQHLRTVEVLDVVDKGTLAQVDRVELAARGAHAAAEALVRIDEGGTAAEAARGLKLELLLGKGLAVVFEGGGLGLVLARDLTRGGVIIALDGVEATISEFP